MILLLLFMLTSTDMLALSDSSAGVSSETRIEESLSSGNLTVVQGETVMLVCTVLNLGDKSVSWVRLKDPNPQLMSLNNVTNSQNPRFRALVSDWKEFVLLVKNVKEEDAGLYQCQVSGPKHTSITRTVSLTVIEGNTEILDGPVIYVDPLSTLTLTCRVDFGHKTPEFLIWRKEDKILKFEGGEGMVEPYLEQDQQGRHLSHLHVKNVGRSESGQYFCQPSIGPQHSVMVHVLDRYTDVLPVLGEGGVGDGDKILVSTLSEKSTGARISFSFILILIVQQI